MESRFSLTAPDTTLLPWILEWFERIQQWNVHCTTMKLFSEFYISESYLTLLTVLIIGDNTDTCQQGIWSDLILEITPSTVHLYGINYKIIILLIQPTLLIIHKNGSL